MSTVTCARVCFVHDNCELISAAATHSSLPKKKKEKKVMRRSQQNQAPVIPNDRLEHDRIMLETNLRHSEAAIHLSSDADDLESLEYPRHNSGHVSLGELPSLDHRVRDYLADEDTPGQGWSYRTVDDDDEGIHPYGSESLSTLAHHASAVTLGAGLGGRGARRDASMSGAEYDPDRPIHDIIAGVTGKLNVFDTKRQVNYCPGCNIYLQSTILD